MAAKNSEMKFAIFFVDLLTTTSLMALRDMPPQETLLKMKLFPTNILGTCNYYCTSNSDCIGITFCQWCKVKTNPYDGSASRTCSVLP
uniref:Metallocarboxypeptidase inhibitor n=1 Tax=Solanum palustre TaxID=4115 RepID=Q949A1_SOLPL|nr:metallocarboxypeptidase inhibitor [Solanum palustre]